MGIYYDRQGNMYKVNDTKQLKKKDQVEVFDEAGEAYHLSAKVADEYKLTDDEKAKIVSELSAKIANLLKAIGLGTVDIPGLSGGCPNIDPPDLGAVIGTRVQPQYRVVAELLKALLGGGCPNIDPADLGTILGTRVNPQAMAIAGLMNKAFAGCPNMDPPDKGTIFGTLANPQLRALLNLYNQGLSGGCLSMDPPNLRNILGTRVYPQQELAINLAKALLGAV